MSLHEYEASNRVNHGFSFVSIIMAAMRRADSDDTYKLKTMWPEIWEELSARYNAPGGRLPGDERRKADRRRLSIDYEPGYDFTGDEQRSGVDRRGS